MQSQQRRCRLSGLCLALGLSAAHFVLLALVATRWTIKPILVFLFFTLRRLLKGLGALTGFKDEEMMLPR